ncbi:polysaccharide pyruvyl transferase family protein [Pontibacter mangrovi]|uniref:Polysaccharide pyruvyl transferase family protein n=1 Tax=Pontibacter mangrovi TaxID=2589816 RepID=A0A501VZR4_9BACT|nr:polysaccharide pyruvyl transferase family protein [Pontibacter mangrovi]TPE40007.1 polysaccharide pyruvyl transferase family protein [Pontibacter mangrovi]
MVIELKGMGVQNKGAHLMLEAVQQQFEQHNVILAISWDSGGVGYRRAKELGLFYLPPNLGKKALLFKLIKHLPMNIRRSFKIILDEEVDVILDGSGFAYGDFWGANKPLKRFQNVLAGKTPKYAKSILLPQALGTFNDEKVKHSFKKVLDKSDLVFVRDEQSMDYMIDAYGQQEKFILAPDFTNLVDAGPEQKYPEGEICLIPNYKMFTQDKEAYMGFLINVRTFLKNQEKKVYYLIHEGERDKQIAKDLNKRLALNDPIVEEFDPIKIKNRIKSADLIIVSRFHGLVSALSQGVPAITTSWSHKYQILMKEYGQEDALVDIRNYEFENVKDLISELLSKGKAAFQNEQSNTIQKQKERSKLMWETLKNHISI